MFRFPGKPSPKADMSELADFLEILAWINRSASAREAIRYLGLVDDEITEEGEVYEGCEDQQDEHADELDHVFEELGNRSFACGDAYPFVIDGSAGTVIRLKENIWNNHLNIAYLYLLAATRLNMQRDKIFNDIDGTLEMEHLSALALKQYLGGRCQVFVFGTSGGGTFSEKVNCLMSALKENGRFRNIDGDDVPVTAKDGKLDVVGWLPFRDGKPGQLSIFAQAKTGTTWRDKISEHRPDEFQRKWLTHQLLLEPIRALCVAEAAEPKSWDSTCVGAGLFLDRCRLVECFSQNPDAQVPEKIITWTRAAFEKIEEYIAA